MRVAIITESFAPDINGVANSVLRIAEHLVARGHKPLVIAPDPRRSVRRKVLDLPYPVVRVPSLPLPGYTNVRLALPSAAVRAALSRHRADVVHLASPFVLGAWGSSAAQELGLPIVPRPQPVSGPGRWLPVLAVIPAIAASRTWWIGFGLNVAGFWLHSAALHLASITIVQALLSVQLVFAVPFGAMRTHSRPLVRDWIGALASCAGVVILVLTRGGAEQTMSRSHLVPAVLGLGATAIVTLVGCARLVPRRTRTALVGTAAGVGFSLTAVLIIVTADRLVRTGWLSLLSGWSLYALALSGLTSAILVQDAFASGSLPAAMTAMLVADPVASWVWGAVVFDRVCPTLPVLAAMAACALLVAAGVALLAYSPTARTAAVRSSAPDRSPAHVRPEGVNVSASRLGPDGAT